MYRTYIESFSGIMPKHKVENEFKNVCEMKYGKHCHKLKKNRNRMLLSREHEAYILI